MRLLIVNQYALPKGLPGITRHGDLGAELVGRGHAVVVLASRFHYMTRSEGGSRRGVEHHSGVEFRWLDTGSYRVNDRRRTRSMLSFVLHAIREGWSLSPRPDVVLASSPHLLAGLVGIILSRRFRVPFVFEIRDLWPSALVDLGAVRSGSTVHRALTWLERLCYRLAARIVTVPPHADRRVAEVGGDPSRCTHIPNSTSIEAPRNVGLPVSLKEVLRAIGKRELLVYAGAQGVSNGLQTLLDALDVLRRTDPETYHRLAVLLIGDGAQHAELVHAARRNGHGAVYFHPPVGKSVVGSVLDRAAILLVSFADAPVYSYGLSPNKLFDYLAAARPVLLASRLDDTPVDEAGAGRRYEPGSPTSLAEGISSLLRLSEEERRRMGERGRELVKRRYTLPIAAAQLEDVLEELVTVDRA